MSFILDALKKSEMERQRQTVPGLMDTRAARRRSRFPFWAVALAVLLAINLFVLTFVLLRRSAPAAPVEPAARQVNAPPAVSVDAPPATAHFSPLDAAPVYAPEIPVANAGAHASPAHSAHRPDPLLSDADTNADVQEVLPTINEISLSGAQALPELHLDVHVFATNPPDRFVYINMRKYREGAALQEGPILERIRRDGVVLNYQGLRFILPRQP
jgi:general secretion pathway protein B